jgi:hypothetical protein
LFLLIISLLSQSVEGVIKNELAWGVRAPLQEYMVMRDFEVYQQPKEV